ncbi:Uncharacterized protein PBTT_02062 [Plasmodiophora brassicae]|uniref:Uncharacterized protein n=1 Tax=Plasmodiophora brassicae TaxID=37360 RepID=A0A0G4J508_PLABS|nr:hypothetical protein PBRA_002588 [Plasmodiophora brassicae]
MSTIQLRFSRRSAAESASAAAASSPVPGRAPSIAVRPRPQLRFNLEAAIARCQRLAEEDVALGLRYGTPPWEVSSRFDHVGERPQSPPPPPPAPVAVMRPPRDRRTKSAPNPKAVPLLKPISEAIERESRRLEEQSDCLDDVPTRQAPTPLARSEIESERAAALRILDDIRRQIREEQRQRQGDGDPLHAAHLLVRDVVATGRSEIVSRAGRAATQCRSVEDAQRLASSLRETMSPLIEDAEAIVAHLDRRPAGQRRPQDIVAFADDILDDLLTDAVQALNQTDLTQAMASRTTVDELQREKARIARRLLEPQANTEAKAVVTDVSVRAKQALRLADDQLSAISRFVPDDDADQAGLPAPRVGSDDLYRCRDEYLEFVNRTQGGLYEQTGIMPWQLVESVADSVVDDAIGNVFTELSTIFDGFIDGMVGNELQPLPELDVPPIT